MMAKRSPTAAALTAAVLAFSGSLAGAADKYTVDGVHSTVVFRIKHLGVSYSYGRFNDVSGSFAFDEADAAKSAVTLELKTDSIDTNSGKRDTHLKSPDFFNAAQYPKITFASKTVKSTGKGAYEVTGDLTLHGVTKPVTAAVEVVGAMEHPRGGKKSGFETTLTIKRSDFDMKYMLDGLGDEVRVTVSIEGNQEK